MRAKRTQWKLNRLMGTPALLTPSFLLAKGLSPTWLRYVANTWDRALEGNRPWTDLFPSAIPENVQLFIFSLYEVRATEKGSCK